MTTATHTSAQDSLRGGYTIVGGEKYGKPIPPGHIEGSTVRIADNAIVVTDKDKKDVYASTYTIEAGDGNGPWTIKMTSKVVPENGDKQETATGLIEKTGDTVRLIYAIEGGAAPTSFKTGEKQLMFEMKNLNK